MQVVSARAAAQQLRRYRQRIVSRLRSLKAKLTFPQQLSHSRNLRGILRERRSSSVTLLKRTNGKSCSWMKALRDKLN